jgi:hypothetical protein
MALHIQSIHSIRRLSKWLVNWSIALIIITGVLSIETLYQNLQYLFTGDEKFFLEYVGPTLIFAAAYFVIEIVASIITLYWYYRANKNTHIFGATGISSPIMAVIWWFIPILNLWKPYTVARDIWKVSASHAGLENSTGLKELPSWNTIKLWWILGLLAVLLTVVNGAFTGFDYSDTELVGQDLVAINKITYYSNFIVISIYILSITSTLFFIRMIKRVSVWQEPRQGPSSLDMTMT